jgi:histidyl-tRNA synthetase
MIQSLRGMNDIESIDGEKYTKFIEVASKISKQYGFQFLKTPILEDSALFYKAVGESSDIVNKEMYNFVDKGENNICMRPEGTAGVSRYFIEKKKDRVGNVCRYFYYGSMFRYERPQSGRLREFSQFGCESFASDSFFEDILIISIVRDIFNYFNIKFNLDINSIGCNKCLIPFKEKIKKELLDDIDNFCIDCKTRIDKNPLRVFDCKNKNCIEKLEKYTTITDNLCDQCQDDFDNLQEILVENGIDFNINKKLVRGLDYYTKTIFEFTSSNIGSQNALCGGGRYNNLISSMGGRETPAVGFAIGIERILPLIDVKIKNQNNIYLGYQNEDDNVFSLFLALSKSNQLFLEYKKRSFTKHLHYATKLQAEVAILKQSEDIFFVKNFKTQEEFKMSFKEVVERYSKRKEDGSC